MNKIRWKGSSNFNFIQQFLAVGIDIVTGLELPIKVALVLIDSNFIFPYFIFTPDGVIQDTGRFKFTTKSIILLIILDCYLSIL